jgi:hypothetical protein
MIFVERDIVVVDSCQCMLYKSVLIHNLFSTMANYTTYRVGAIGVPDRFMSGFLSWQQKIIPYPSVILSYII